MLPSFPLHYRPCMETEPPAARAPPLISFRPLPTVSITGELLHLITLTSSFNFVPHPSFQATGAPPPMKSRAGRRCLPPGAEIRPSLLLPAAEEGSLFVALKTKSFKKARDEKRAVRAAFRWRKKQKV